MEKYFLIKMMGYSARLIYVRGRYVIRMERDRVVIEVGGKDIEGAMIAGWEVVKEMGK